MCGVSDPSHLILLFRTVAGVDSRTTGVRGFKRLTAESTSMDADEFTDTLRELMEDGDVFRPDSWTVQRLKGGVQ
ncbi:MAG: hypothetical protein ABEI99_01590 [Halobaculum sp.]